MFNRIFAAVATIGDQPDRLMIDAHHPKSRRIAISLVEKGYSPTRRLTAQQRRPAPSLIRHPDRAMPPVFVSTIWRRSAQNRR
ncbi:MAG: hypothetical protein ABW173_04795 [Sphingomonas sp.]